MLTKSLHELALKVDRNELRRSQSIKEMHDVKRHKSSLSISIKKKLYEILAV